MPFTLPPQRLPAGAIAGIVAAGAYALEQDIDMRMFACPTDDRLLLGRLVVRDNGAARTIGLGMHLTNGVVAGVAYTLVAEPILPGPPVVKGLAFAMAETIALYPLAVFGGVHPAIKDGTLPSYLTPTAFVQQVLRHLAFGATLGPVAARLLRHAHDS